LTDEEIQFIKDNAEAVEEALNGKRTQRAEDGTPKLKSDDGNLGIYVNAGKSFSINCPAISGVRCLQVGCVL
jgi:hypothetical protein